MGTMMPRAPASRTYLICHVALPSAQGPVAGMRTTTLGALGPTPETAAMVSAAPGWSGIKPCSQSITNHERWGDASAAVRAVHAPGTVSHAPNAGLDVLKACKRGCEAMVGDRTRVILERLCKSYTAIYTGVPAYEVRL